MKNNNNLTVLIDAPGFPLAYWNALHSSVREKIAPDLNKMQKAANVAVTPDTRYSQAFLETGLCPNVDFDLDGSLKLPSQLSDSVSSTASYSFGKFSYELSDNVDVVGDDVLMREAGGSGPNFVSNDGVSYTGVIPTLINFAADMKNSDGRHSNYFIRINADACEKNRDLNANIDGAGEIDPESYPEKILGHRLVKPHRYRHDSLNSQSHNAMLLSRAYWGENFDRAAIAAIHAIRNVNHIVSGIMKMCASTSLGKGKMLKDILKMILWTPSVTKPPSIGQVLDGSLSSTEGSIFTNSTDGNGDVFVSIPEFRNQIMRACRGEDMDFQSHSFGLSYVDPKMDYILSKQGDSHPYWTSVYLSHNDTWVCVPFSVTDTQPAHISDESEWIVNRRGSGSPDTVSMSNIRPFLPDSFKINSGGDIPIGPSPFLKYSNVSLDKISDQFSRDYPCLRVIRVIPDKEVVDTQPPSDEDVKAVESIQRWWKKNNKIKKEKNKHNKNNKNKSKNTNNNKEGRKNKIKMPSWRKRPNVRHLKPRVYDQTLHVYRNGQDVTPVHSSFNNDGITVYYKGCPCGN